MERWIDFTNNDLFHTALAMQIYELDSSKRLKPVEIGGITLSTISCVHSAHG